MGYRGQNGIYEDVLEISRPVISFIQILEPEDEPMTRGMLYNCTILKSPVTGHLGKMIINSNW